MIRRGGWIRLDGGRCRYRRGVRKVVEHAKSIASWPVGSHRDEATRWRRAYPRPNLCWGPSPNFPQTADGSGSGNQNIVRRQRHDQTRRRTDMRSATLSGERLSSLLPTNGWAEDAARRPTVFDAVIYRLKTGVPWRTSRAVPGPWEVGLQSVCQLVSTRFWRHFLSRYSSTSMTRSSIVDLPSSAHQRRCGRKGGSRPIVWVAVAAVFRRRFTSSWTCEGGLCLSRTDARPASRNHRRPTAHRARARPGFPRGHRLRQQ